MADKRDNCMNNRFPVFNITQGHNVRYKQALKSIEACSCAWVVEGESVRDLTLAEAIQARNVQAKMRDPLPYAELFGLRFEGKEEGKRERNMLVWEATQFVSEKLEAA
jgi:hypothetical protein